MAKASLRRPNYFNGMQLGVGDFRAEQSYLDTLRTLYNSRLHTWGIAEGLDVRIGDDQRSVKVLGGVAYDQVGQEIVLAADTVIASPPLSSQPVDLFIVLSGPVRADLSQASLALGYKRIEHPATLSFTPVGASVDPSAVFLARVLLDANSRVTGLQLDARRYCGFDLGRLTLLEPEGGAMAAMLSSVAGGDEATLAVQAQELQFYGQVEIAGGLAIGVVHPRAALDVLSDAPILVSVAGESGAPLLTVLQGGLSGVGVDDPDARLTVDGDIALDAGRALLFDGGGVVQGGTAPCALTLAPTGQPMSLAEAGRIDLCSGGRSTATMTLIANGNVGIDELAPSEALSVDGPIQSLSGGFAFANGGVQPTAAVSTTVRVGGVIDWWPGGVITLPPEFMVCDGSTVADKDSPYYGRKLPNLIGAYVRGTTDYSAIGATGGAASHAHQIMTLPIHTHDITHYHPKVTQRTEEDTGEGDSDTTDDKCSHVNHTHSIDILVQQSLENNSRENDPTIPAIVTQPVNNQPASYGLVKIMRIK